jgi:16S rRNA (uracil1498-N3)-methyltransferase
MRQFSLPPDWRPGRPCVLEGGRARYLARVLRLGAGDLFPGIDSSGGRWLCELAESSPDRLVIAVRPLPPDWEKRDYLEDLRSGRTEERLRRTLEKRLRSAAAAPERGVGARPGGTVAAPEPRPRIVLAQGLPKGAKMDLIVRQAAEAGVSRVIPILARRSVAGKPAAGKPAAGKPAAGQAAAGEAAAGRLERWRRIAREALQQSGSAVPTRIEEPVAPEGLIGALGAPRGKRIALLLDAEARDGEDSSAAAAGPAPLAQASLHGYLSEAPDEVVLCVGPEGGFDARENGTFAEAGFVPLRLPCAVLRTETAALYAVAAVEIVLSERMSWIPKAR